MLDESLCVPSKTTSCGGRSDGANVTVFLWFASSSSKVALLQTLLRHMYLAGSLGMTGREHIGGVH